MTVFHSFSEKKDVQFLSHSNSCSPLFLSALLGEEPLVGREKIDNDSVKKPGRESSHQVCHLRISLE